jgi:hypothetical protein
MARRKNPVMRVGNYAAPVDTEGMDPDMKDFTKERKVSDKDYLADQKKRVNDFRTKRGKKPL